MDEFVCDNSDRNCEEHRTGPSSQDTAVGNSPHYSIISEG